MGTLPLTLAFSMVSLILSGTIWVKARLHNEENLRSLKRYEGFYSSEIAAWHGERRTPALPATEGNSSRKTSIPLNPFYVPKEPKDKKEKKEKTKQERKNSTQNNLQAEGVTSGSRDYPYCHELSEAQRYTRCRLVADSYSGSNYQEGQPVNFAVTQQLLETRSFIPKPLTDETENSILNVQVSHPERYGSDLKYCGNQYFTKQNNSYQTCLAKNDSFKSIIPPPPTGGTEPPADVVGGTSTKVPQPGEGPSDTTSPGNSTGGGKNGGNTGSGSGSSKSGGKGSGGVTDPTDSGSGSDSGTSGGGDGSGSSGGSADLKIAFVGVGNIKSTDGTVDCGRSKNTTACSYQNYNVGDQVTLTASDVKQGSCTITFDHFEVTGTSCTLSEPTAVINGNSVTITLAECGENVVEAHFRVIGVCGPGL